MTTRASTADLFAGLSIAGLLLPEAVAYSGLSNLPPQAGVIALFAGLVCYGLIGRSRFAIVTATSSSAAVLASATLTLGGGDLAPTRGARCDPGGRRRRRLRPGRVLYAWRDVDLIFAPRYCAATLWPRAGDRGQAVPHLVGMHTKRPISCRWSPRWCAAPQHGKSRALGCGLIALAGGCSGSSARRAVPGALV